MISYKDGSRPGFCYLFGDLMKKSVRYFSLLLLFACLLSICSACRYGDSQNEDGFEEESYYTFQDSLGYDVSLYDSPQTVAVLFSSYAEIWSLSGGKIAITVGDSIDRGFAQANTPLVDDGAGLKINTERLIALQPDFVIGSADMSAQVEACNRLRKMDVPCALFREETVQDYLSILKIFTDINQTPDAYTAYGTEVANRIHTILETANQCAAAQDRPTSVLFIRAGSGGSSTRAKTAENHFVGIMLNELGTVNIADAAKELSESLSLEYILLQQPDVIFIVPQGDETAAIHYMNSVLAQPGWKDLSAVQGNAVHYLSKALFHYKPNSHWDEAYALLASILYPQSFACP